MTDPQNKQEREMNNEEFNHNHFAELYTLRAQATDSKGVSWYQNAVSERVKRVKLENWMKQNGFPFPPADEVLSSVPQDQHHAIKDSLAMIERKHDVKIIYACESGSRAWGFHSPDSDFDVRFIYVRTPKTYVQIAPARHVIEEPISDDLDINGWDLTFALQLLRKGNPTLLEWFNSPIVYKCTKEGQRLRVFSKAGFRHEAGWHHYYNVARANYDRFSKRGKLKKYFYVLRSIFAAQWVLTRGDCPPVPFEEVMMGCGLVQDGSPLHQEIKALHAQKTSAAESHICEAPKVIDDFIQAYLANNSQKRLDVNDPRPKISIDKCNELLQSLVFNQK